MRVILLAEDLSWFDADPETAMIQVSHYMTFTPGCSSKHARYRGRGPICSQAGEDYDNTRNEWVIGGLIGTELSTRMSDWARGIVPYLLESLIVDKASGVLRHLELPLLDMLTELPTQS